MGLRVLQLCAVTLYLVGAIGAVAYFGYSPFWLIPVLAPALYYLFTLPEVPGYGAKVHQKRIKKRVLELKKDASNVVFVPLVERGYLISDAEIAQRKRRIAELEAVPHRRKYIPRIIAGENISDDEIDYREDPSKLRLCLHLQPLEQALRASGASLRPYPGAAVFSASPIEWPAFRERFALPETIIYEQVPGDRFGPDTQRLTCTLCSSWLESA
ncbi:MAG TPA: hypothetical protein VFQ91_09950 [Bryobacteraceae bacterium]|nr:hypothetical protein [Bryobacteraceae bacterium]